MAAETLRSYLRVSRDLSGRSASTERQDRELRERAERHGWAYHPAPYVDRGLSASMYAERGRPDFEALLRDLADGTFGADLLGLYEPSRGTRQPGEFEELLRLTATAKVRIYVATHDRVYDPANARDRRTLREDAIDSAYESDKTSERTRSEAAASAAAGRPWGSAPYGYRRVYNATNGRLEGQAEVPHEAEVIRDLFAKLAAGWSLSAIADDFCARGLTTRAGRPWTAKRLRYQATLEAYAGRRVHHGRTTPATWEPIVDPALFDQVQVMLSDPRRKTVRPGSGVHLLSFIGRCGVCGAPLAAAVRGEKPHYTCHAKSTCVQVNERLADEVATRAVIGYLSRPDVYEMLSAERGETPELQRIRADLAAARRQLQELHEAIGQRRLSIQAAMVAEPALLKTIADLERAEREATLPAVLVGLAGDEVEARWARMPMSAKREVCRLLFSPGVLGTLLVYPVADRSWCEDPSHGRPVRLCSHIVERRIRFGIE